jgi:hypothetical protein
VVVTSFQDRFDINFFEENDIDELDGGKEDVNFESGVCVAFVERMCLTSWRMKVMANSVKCTRTDVSSSRT